MEWTVPKSDDPSTEYSDLFLAAEPLIYELRRSVGVLTYLGVSDNQVEPEEILLVAGKLEKAVEKLQAAWDAEDKWRAAAAAARLVTERLKGRET